MIDFLDNSVVKTTLTMYLFSAEKRFTHNHYLVNILIEIQLTIVEHHESYYIIIKLRVNAQKLKAS